MINQLMDLYAFHKKFGLIPKSKPDQLDLDFAMTRAMSLIEESNEFIAARLNDDVEGQLDALIDLLYFAYGTLHLMGMMDIAEIAWDRVHAANMAKKKAENSGESKRFFKFDVIKPPGFVTPTFGDLIDAPENQYNKEEEEREEKEKEDFDRC